MERKRKTPTVIRKSANTRKKTIPFLIAVANKVLNAIDFVDFINRAVTWDTEQCKVSPGHLAKAVILVTFFDIRAPLSRISETFQEIDTEFLFGQGILAEDLNDYAIARTLDKIAAADMGPDTMFSTLCLVAYSVYEIAMKRLHSDTTSVSFYGDYRGEGEQEGENTDGTGITDEEILQIVHGYNKDGRPECKQVVVGKIVNEHGVPVAHSVMDGNTSDVEWNTKALDMVGDVFAKDLDECIYIADSKLINMNLFRTMMNPKKVIRFISRCPANFSEKLAARATAQAYKDDDWVVLDPFSDRKNASEYQSQEYRMTVDRRKVRCIVYKTSDGEKRFLRKKDNALDALQQDIKETEKKEFVCEADAVKEQQRFEKTHRRSVYTCTFRIEPVHTEKRPRGNPGKHPKPPIVVTKWYVHVDVAGENPELMKQLQYKEECIVLITNVAADEFDMWDILNYYKNQSVVEIQFRLLKQPCIGSVIYLKTPQRIRALVMLLGIALLIRALVQYKLRKGFEENTEELPPIGWNGGKLQPNLTLFFLKSALVNHAFTREGRDEYSYSFSNPFDEQRIATLVRFLGLTVEELIE